MNQTWPRVWRFWKIIASWAASYPGSFKTLYIGLPLSGEGQSLGLVKWQKSFPTEAFLRCLFPPSCVYYAGRDWVVTEFPSSHPSGDAFGDWLLDFVVISLWMFKYIPLSPIYLPSKTCVVSWVCASGLCSSLISGAGAETWPHVLYIPTSFRLQSLAVKKKLRGNKHIRYNRDK